MDITALVSQRPQWLRGIRILFYAPAVLYSPWCWRSPAADSRNGNENGKCEPLGLRWKGARVGASVK